MTTQEEPTVSRTTSTPANGTEAVEDVDPTADPVVPSWDDLPPFDRENGHGDPLTTKDLRVHDLEQVLRDMWEKELGDILVKAQTYGGGANSDLDIMAGAMRVIMPSIQDQRQGLMAVLAFYQLGKVARTLASLSAGVMPSFDTVRDSHVYGLMQMKVGETGRWL
jgi:hypothetical protein